METIPQFVDIPLGFSRGSDEIVLQRMAAHRLLGTDRHNLCFREHCFAPIFSTLNQSEHFLTFVPFRKHFGLFF